MWGRRTDEKSMQQRIEVLEYQVQNYQRHVEIYRNMYLVTHKQVVDLNNALRRANYRLARNKACSFHRRTIRDVCRDCKKARNEKLD